jgi:hypothetical protein
MARSEFDLVAYGALFRPDASGKVQIPRGQDWIQGSTFQVEDEWEYELIENWWRPAADLSASNRVRDLTDPLGEDPYIEPLDLQGRARVPSFVQAGLLQLAKSRFFRPFAPQLLILELRQVREFLANPAFKKTILDRFSRKISSETCVVIGHSLGSVVAYEALCLHPEWRIKMFITIGSPLGIPSVVFDALTPRPQNGVGSCPAVSRWVNIADEGDLVALEKRLSSRFAQVEDISVYNGWKSHDALRYLTTAELGRVLSEGLRLCSSRNVPCPMD